MSERRNFANVRFGERDFRALLRATHQRARSSGQHWRTHERDHLLLYLMGLTGLRVGEAVKVQVDDLVLHHKIPFLRVKTLKKKGVGRWDDVFLDPDLARRLKRYLHICIPRYSRHRGLRPGDRLFPFSIRNAQKIFYRYAQLAGLHAGYSIHALRHYRGSQLLHATGDLEFTRNQLRHQSIRSTQIYLHTDPRRISGYMKRLEALRREIGEEARG